MSLAASGTPLNLLTMSGGSYRTEPGKFRLAELFDDDGRVVAKVIAVGEYRRADDDTELNGPGRVKVFSQYKLEASSGRAYYGCTVIPYVLDSGITLNRVISGVNLINVELNGLTFTYRTRQITRLAPYEPFRPVPRFRLMSDGLVEG